MSLHRSSSVPDWELVPPDEWNIYQARAAETNGWDTPGNRETLKGVVASTLGLLAVRQDHNLIGLSLLAYGRWKDLSDGAKAEATGTKSPKGEALDAVADKALIAMTLPVLSSREVISNSEAAVIGFQAGANSLVSILAKLSEQKLAPSKLGKYATFTIWTSLGFGLAAENVPAKGSAQTLLKKAQRGSLAAGLTMGAAASLDYIRQYRASQAVLD